MSDPADDSDNTSIASSADPTSSSLLELPVFGPAPDSAEDTDDASSTHDSLIGSYVSTSTSVHASLYNFRYENGRRYHAYSAGGSLYILPNDDSELERLDLQHHLFLITFGGRLHLAPLDIASELAQGETSNGITSDPREVNSRRIRDVLDIGTGTGIWAVDFADIYSVETRVTGVDLSPVQPTYVPPNCRFYVEDVESEWAAETSSYDYIHVRMLVCGIRNWERLVQRAFDSLRPGGWLEIQDICFPSRCDDDTVPPDSPLGRWSQLMTEAAIVLGLDLTIAARMPDMLRNAGFENVRSEWFTWPLGTWPKDEKDKERGAWAWHDFQSGLDGFSMGFFSRGLGWSRLQVDEMVNSVREQIVGGRRVHSYVPIGVIMGKKPDN